MVTMNHAKRKIPSAEWSSSGFSYEATMPVLGRRMDAYESQNAP
jgi:hypothetical protein